MALLLTLRDGGARLVSTGNLNTTQPDAVEALRAEGITVIGGPTRDSEVHASYLDEVLAAKPDLILDNGGDLFARYLDRPYEALLGGTEETTSGRMRLEPVRGQLKRPILVINDSPIKQFAENEHAVGQSALESFLRMTNRVTNGEQVTVFGYGACGRGVAANFRGACAWVSVVDVNPSPGFGRTWTGSARRRAMSPSRTQRPGVLRLEPGRGRHRPARGPRRGARLLPDLRRAGAHGRRRPAPGGRHRQKGSSPRRSSPAAGNAIASACASRQPTPIPLTRCSPPSPGGASLPAAAASSPDSAKREGPDTLARPCQQSPSMLAWPC